MSGFNPQIFKWARDSAGLTMDDAAEALKIKVATLAAFEVGEDVPSRPQSTTLVWAELPGSFTFEVPDLPALCAAAHQHGALVALDTTWGAGVAYAGFDFDIDFAVQSLTKFASGTSEVVMGSVATWPVAYRRSRMPAGSNRST